MTILFLTTNQSHPAIPRSTQPNVCSSQQTTLRYPTAICPNTLLTYLVQHGTTVSTPFAEVIKLIVLYALFEYWVADSFSGNIIDLK